MLQRNAIDVARRLRISAFSLIFESNMKEHKK